MSSLWFVGATEDLIFLSPIGRGKTARRHGVDVAVPRLREGAPGLGSPGHASVSVPRAPDRRPAPSASSITVLFALTSRVMVEGMVPLAEAIFVTL